MFFDPAFHLFFHSLNCFQFKNFKKRRFFVHTHTIFDVCVLKKYIKNGISAKKIVTKKVFGGKNVRDFFSNFKIKKNFKILENIFLDFSFSKKQ